MLTYWVGAHAEASQSPTLPVANLSKPSELCSSKSTRPCATTTYHRCCLASPKRLPPMDPIRVTFAGAQAMLHGPPLIRPGLATGCQLPTCVHVWIPPTARPCPVVLFAPWSGPHAAHRLLQQYRSPNTPTDPPNPVAQASLRVGYPVPLRARLAEMLQPRDRSSIVRKQ